MEYTTEDLSLQLKQLRLHYTADNIDSVLESLGNKGPKEVLSHLALVESVERKNRSITRRMAEARIGRFKRMEDFDWSHPDDINRAKVESLFESDFTSLGKNLIIIGTQGLGKTMIARNLAASAVQKGHSARFVTASKMVADLLSAGHTLESRFRYYTRFDLLVIDELGYLSYQDRAADMLFEIVSRRYEKSPIVLTTNRTFSEWPEVFPGAACVSALLDRLIHHCEFIQIKGASYRKAQSGSKAATSDPKDSPVPT